MNHGIRHILLSALLVVLAFGVEAQTTMPSNSSESGKKYKAKELEKSLESGNAADVAANYERLAAEFASKGEHAKAEEYLKKALDIYLKEKDKKKISEVNRSLAGVQEQQKKYDQAISGYQQAAEWAPEKNAVQMNNNDVQRLQQAGNAEEQIKLLDANIVILESEGKKDETAELFIKKAEAELNADKKSEAKESISRAIEAKNATPLDALNFKTNATKLLGESNLYAEALELGNANLKEAQSTGDAGLEIVQRNYLADILDKMKLAEQAEAHWTEAYQVALDHGRTREATEVIKNIAQHFAARGLPGKAIEWHNRFLTDFDQFIKADSSLVDAKIFEVTESRIRQLETERALKDELIQKTGRFNFILIGSVILLIVLMSLLAKTVISVRQRNKRIALQSLRREMNPHFIFNSLNSVNHFIAENNELEANKYLTSYSTLMRNMMESSNKDFITLANETEQLRKYLNLEHLRFKDKFDFEISIDDSLDSESVWVPNMLLQPHLENAIWHGLRYRESKGMLRLIFSDFGHYVKATIEDNGIGVAKSKELKTQNQRVHESRGLNNVAERIRLLNQLYHLKITFSIVDNPSGEGTRVEVLLAKSNKPA